jgi:hypothetical protein
VTTGSFTVRTVWHPTTPPQMTQRGPECSHPTYLEQARASPSGSNTRCARASPIDIPVTTSITRPATPQPALLYENTSPGRAS